MRLTEARRLHPAVWLGRVDAGERRP